jgi:hypothetical protein
MVNLGIGIVHMSRWYIFWSIGIFFTNFGMLHQEKSGNPAVYQADF